MHNGLMFCFLGALSFGLLGCASKFAAQKNGQASVLVILLFGWAALVMLVGSAGLPSPLSVPLRTPAVAVACGICAGRVHLSSHPLPRLSISFMLAALAWSQSPSAPPHPPRPTRTAAAIFGFLKFAPRGGVD
jgi:hypothetical protein